MQKQILYFICVFFLFGSLMAYASEDATKSNGVGKVGTHNNGEHPPHTHDTHDHLKHIRGHGSERKKKSPKS